MAFENRRLTSLIIYDLSGNPILRINKTEGLIVLDPTSASYVQVLPASSQAQMRLYPGNLVGETPQYGQVYADFNPLAPHNFIRGRLILTSPAPTPTADVSTIQLLSESVDLVDPSTITIAAAITEIGANFLVTTDGHARVLNSLICTSENGFTQQCAAADTTTNAALTDMGGAGNTVSFSFTKLYAETRIRLDMSGGWFCTNTGTDAEFAVRINGVDYVIDYLASSVGTDRLKFGGFVYVGSAVVPAGTYTVQARWRRPSGVGTLSRQAGKDMLSMSAREVAA